MKTRSYAFLIFLLSVSGVSGIANAGLSVFGPQIVLDDNGTPGQSDDLYFFRDLSRFGDMTYVEQLASIDLLNVELSGAGPWQNDWHLAGAAEMRAVLTDYWTEVPDVFLPSYGTDFVGRYDYVYPPSGHHAYEVIVTGGSPPLSHDIYGVSDTSDYPLLGAWAVATPVPSPSSAALLLLGVSIVGWGKRRRHGG